ncbi:MAG: LysR family transcriptional regulator [Vannielia sp.]|uniref:LysR family transcriptional regulator n=1 Tax=Rhodobacterales TaxID=204455 RepID=UPI0020947FEE|nr:LysR family transcriptional regulator [Oceanicola sp. 502str15]MCO6382486.1 LysR family transcriptional regulator [Oceanicola sp. 502str15]
MIDTDLIRTFLAIHDTGSFSAAAKRVLRTPSAVSMQIKRLEEQLGRTLFERLPREVRLTGDGEAFLSYAEEMMRVSEAALARFSGAPIEGQVRFGAPGDLGAHALPIVLRRFAASHPGVDVRVTLDTSERLTAAHEAGELDVALHTVCATTGGAGRLVYEESLAWAGKRGGRAWKSDPVPLALSQDGCVWRRKALKSMGLVGKTARVAYVSESGQALLAAVEADLAITPLPLANFTPEMERLTADKGFGDIGKYQLRMMEQDDAGCAARALAEHVVESFCSRPGAAALAAE